MWTRLGMPPSLEARRKSNAAWRSAHPEHVEYVRAWRKQNPTYSKKWNKERREGLLGPFTEADGPDWQQRNREDYLRRKHESTNRIRRKRFVEAIQKYGGQCYCCGETELLCLGLDHIHGGGNAHRKEMKTRAPEWAKKNGWPAIFRVACHSCNLGAHLNGGVCPHQNQPERHIRIRVDTHGDQT